MRKMRYAMSMYSQDNRTENTYTKIRARMNWYYIENEIKYKKMELEKEMQRINRLKRAVPPPRKMNRSRRRLNLVINVLKKLSF